MIIFNNLSKENPYVMFKEKYDQAIESEQEYIESICISSFSTKNHEVNARFVNLKFINNNEFIFFSNYDSEKANEFKMHNQIVGVIFWNSINVQIRMKAKIKKTPNDFNQKYFFQRSIEKNALAISSYQSQKIGSFSHVKENFNKSLKNDDLKTCPEYWGGYAFIPYYFEFWEGDEFRLNKREVFEKKQGNWSNFLLQP